MAISPNALKHYIPDPMRTVQLLDKHIIGQIEAKKTLALAVFNRGFLRCYREGLITLDHKPEKSNVLLLGSTGVGKTSLIRALGKILGIPITIFDVTSITSSGYIGSKVEDILTQHKEGVVDWVQRQGKSSSFEGQMDYEFLVQELTETGIIYLDEIDKIRIRDGRGTDVNGDMVQNELLKLFDNGDINLQNAHGNSGFKGNAKNMVTDDITFICGGAFSGLADIIKKRLNSKAGIGFNSEVKTLNNDSEVFQHVTNKDLVSYGFKPEFVGRLPLKSILTSLDKEMMMAIISRKEDSILNQYSNVFKSFGIQLTMQEEALDLIATKALKLKAGARSLKTLFGELFTNEIFRIFSFEQEELIVDRAFVESRIKLDEV